MVGPIVDGAQIVAEDLRRVGELLVREAELRDPAPTSTVTRFIPDGDGFEEDFVRLLRFYNLEIRNTSQGLHSKGVNAVFPDGRHFFAQWTS